MAMNKKTVLITGCSDGGIGAALARAFVARDYHVFATLRNTSKAGSLATTPGIEILELEVTSEESISQCAQLVVERTGGRLDVLINNAGADFVMPLLDVNIQAARKLFDLNVFSILATTQKFSPMLINAKGCVCNIASVLALGPFAWSGIYSASKSAAVIISEVLRLELQPLGVRVITGIIGGVETPIHQNAGDLVLPETTYYKAAYQTISDVNNGAAKPRSQPVDVTARAIANDIVGGKSGKIYRGGFASVLGWLSSMVPYSVFVSMISKGRDLEKIEAPQRTKKL